MTYRLALIGGRDGVTYRVTEFEAASEEAAAQVAHQLVGPEPTWGDDQPLRAELVSLTEPNGKHLTLAFG